MNHKDSPASTCPIARSLSVLGDTWSMLILRDANSGLTRFDQFRKSLGIAPTMLTKRLDTLTEEKLLEKRRYSERPPRDEYVLTEAGRDYWPVLFAIAAWGRKHRGDGKLMWFKDAETGTDVRPIVIDAETGAEIGKRELQVVLPK
ncbi:winged helix-turn-helix transcriptional regulator [Pseudomonas sp. 8O]|uniref:winged helix-turn-helix transcriptional regulator n=1 Tax=Pseudomonas sp. 8O TaxID=2653165 RepID=UPI0012EFBE03|nr:helix-turn-helix domain-containing protein [Pseudomonas sp. 8O]VXB17784.1 Transcriptional regulator [Pseudomonas sp. 8O]